MKQSKKITKKKKVTTKTQLAKNNPKTKTKSIKKRQGFFRSLFGSGFPKIDLSETASNVKIVANLPGIDPKDIEINIDESFVRVRGVTHREQQEKGEKFFHFEREYGEFVRDIPLPAKIDARKVSANSKHGVLTITLRKIEAETPRKLTIKKK
jgi:HSP20 family protein